jgi:hypothetical protein
MRNIIGPEVTITEFIKIDVFACASSNQRISTAPNGVGQPYSAAQIVDIYNLTKATTGGSEADRTAAQRWSRKFRPVVKVDRMTKEVIQNEKAKEPFT